MLLRGLLISLLLILALVIYIGIPALTIIGLITVIKWAKKKLATKKVEEKEPPT